MSRILLKRTQALLLSAIMLASFVSCGGEDSSTTTDTVSYNLTALSLSSGTLTPSFDPLVANYEVTLNNTSVAITARCSSNAKVSLNGIIDGMGYATTTLATPNVSNPISIIVGTPEGITKRTYTINFRNPHYDATLSALQFNSCAAYPAFASSVQSYKATNIYSANAITVTPSSSASGTTIKVIQGSSTNSVASGATSPSIPLTVGDNTISVQVISSNQARTNQYSLYLRRLAASSDNSLSGLNSSACALNPFFTSSELNYLGRVDNSVTSLTVTPTATHAGATITVNGSSVNSGATSTPIALSAGSNTITVRVTAEDSSSRDYIFEAVRLPAVVNLLTNGGFELGTGQTSSGEPTIFHWTKMGAASGPIIISSNATPAYAGMNCAYFGDLVLAGREAESTIFPISAAQGMSISIQLYTPDPLTYTKVGVQILYYTDGVGTPASVAANDYTTMANLTSLSNWHQMSWSKVTAGSGTPTKTEIPADATHARLRLKILRTLSAAPSVYFDNITVTQP